MRVVGHLINDERPHPTQGPWERVRLTGKIISPTERRQYLLKACCQKQIGRQFWSSSLRKDEYQREPAEHQCSSVKTSTVDTPIGWTTASVKSESYETPSFVDWIESW